LEDKGEALRLAMEWERLAKGPAPSSLEQARRVTAELVGRLMGAEVVARVSCRAYAEQWLVALKGSVADSTLTFYSGALNAWLAWLGPRAEGPLDGVELGDVVAWRAEELKRVRGKTATHRVKVVRAMFREAVARGYLRKDPTDGLRALKKDRGGPEERKRRPFTREELGRVLAVCDPDWRLLVRLGLVTGQRLGDLIRMDWAQLDLGAGLWVLTTGKTAKRLVVPLPEDVVRDLAERCGRAVQGPVFPELVAEVEAAKGYVGSVSKAFAHALWLAGLRAVNPYGRQPKRREDDAGATREQHELSFHSLRHTARTWLEEAGQPKAVIDALIGHSGDTGKIYTTVGLDALRAAAAVLGAG
jgi:integrase